MSGFSWHVVYAFPADGADRFAALASPIATDLASINAWWRGQDPTREPRFDLHAFPGCSSELGGLDLSRVQLPNAASYYHPLRGRLDNLVADLNAPPFGFVSPDKKYLLYYDGPVESSNTCGQGNAGLTDGGREAWAAVFLQACGQTPGDGETASAITAAHEMMHALNALVVPLPSPGPPHVCSTSDPGHPCDHGADLLYPIGTAADTLSTRILDAGRDDYYGHGGPWWDTQDSFFLARLGGPDQAPPSGPRNLNVTSTGAVATLTWPTAADDVGPVTYRVYADGELLGQTRGTRVNDPATSGQIIQYGLRAFDEAGRLGALLEVRFRVGVGIVDANGTLVTDTVPPPAVTGLRGSITGKKLRLRWNGARDAGGIRGYLVERNRKRFRVVTRTTLLVPLAKAKGTWSVRALDRAGNLGPRVRSIRLG